MRSQPVIGAERKKARGAWRVWRWILLVWAAYALGSLFLPRFFY